MERERLLTSDTDIEVVMWSPRVLCMEFEGMAAADPPPERGIAEEVDRLAN